MRVLLSISAIGLLLLANAFAIEHYLFWKIWWLDIVFHVIGGSLIAALVLSLYSRISLFSLLLISACIGGIWEALEFFITIPFFGIGEGRVTDPIWMLDTIKDFIIDVCASAFVWIAIRAYNKTHG